MAKKTMYVKLAAFLAAVALMLSSSFANNGLMNTSALAEEAITQAAETETDPQTVETADIPGEAEEAEPQITETEEETAPQATEEAAPQAAEAEEETAPQAPEAEEETATQAAEEAEPQTPEAEEETVPETETEPESATEPEEHPEDDQPEAPADDENAEADEDREWIDDDAETADPEEDEDLVVIEDDDVGTVSEEILDAFNNPDLYDQETFIGSAEIMLMNEGMLSYGDEIILKADVRDVNVSYRLVWEANDNDGHDWFAVGSGEEYRFILARENAAREYRVQIYTID